jgi:hypothetical protein
VRRQRRLVLATLVAIVAVGALIPSIADTSDDDD